MNRIPPLAIASKLLTLLLLGTIGASLVFQVAVIVFDSMINKTLDISFILEALSVTPLSLSLFAMFVFPGVTGLGLIHVFVSYIVLFRSRPQFWSRFGLYWLVLIITSGLIGALGMYALYLFGYESPRQALLFTAALGYWGVAIVLSNAWRRGQSSL